jgi:hypothetical protein
MFIHIKETLCSVGMTPVGAEVERNGKNAMHQSFLIHLKSS